MVIELNDEAKSLIRYSLDREENILKLGLDRWKNKLKKFEKEHDMSSQEFMEKFNSGELGDNDEWFDWIFAYKAYSHLIDKLRIIEEIKL